MSRKTTESEDQYSEAETARRRDAIVKSMIATPPQKHEPLKAKRKGSRAKVKRIRTK